MVLVVDDVSNFADPINHLKYFNDQVVCQSNSSLDYFFARTSVLQSSNIGKMSLINDKIQIALTFYYTETVTAISFEDLDKILREFQPETNDQGKKYCSLLQKMILPFHFRAYDSLAELKTYFTGRTSNPQLSEQVVAAINFLIGNGIDLFYPPMYNRAEYDFGYLETLLQTNHSLRKFNFNFEAPYDYFVDSFKWEGALTILNPATEIPQMDLKYFKFTANYTVVMASNFASKQLYSMKSVLNELHMITTKLGESNLEGLLFWMKNETDCGFVSVITNNKSEPQVAIKKFELCYVDDFDSDTDEEAPEELNMIERWFVQIRLDHRRQVKAIQKMNKVKSSPRKQPY